MDAILGLFSEVHHDEGEDAAPAQRLQRASGRALGALAIGALWGAAAGSAEEDEAVLQAAFDELEHPATPQADRAPRSE